MDIARIVSRLIAPYVRRLNNILARGTVSNSNAGTKLQTVQLKLLDGEAKDGVEHFEPYGFTSRPKPGAEHVTVFLDGDRSHGITVVIADRRCRLMGLAEGEVAFFTDEGDRIHFKRGRTIEVSAGTKVNVTAPEVEVIASTNVTITSPLTQISQHVTIGGSLQVTGPITGQGGLAVSGGSGASVTGNMRVSDGNVEVNNGAVIADGINLESHIHGGVQPGSGTTGLAQ